MPYFFPPSQAEVQGDDVQRFDSSPAGPPGAATTGLLSLRQQGPRGAADHRLLAAMRASPHVALCWDSFLGFLGVRLELYVVILPRFPDLIRLLLSHRSRGPRGAAAPRAGEAEHQEELQRPDKPRKLHRSL